MERLRIDKWLWAARFYKTRTLAADEVTLGRVQINDQDIKPAREVRPGDRVRLRQGNGPWREVLVRAISQVRGPAPQAQLLYEETEASREAQQVARERAHYFREPAQTIEQG
ncbi:MAG: RNA-binding S4 domain-containing protein, partial [Limnohabitans sp.]